jgi:hypothetical protein
MVFVEEMIPADYFFQVRRGGKRWKRGTHACMRSGRWLLVTPLLTHASPLPLEQAKAENGQIGYSQSYELRHSGQERKLYGTHMYV